MKPADLRRTLGGALLLTAGAGLWIWNATGDTRPALAPGAALVDSAASPAPAPTGLSLTPAPSATTAPVPSPTTAPVRRPAATPVRTAARAAPAVAKPAPSARATHPQPSAAVATTNAVAAKPPIVRRQPRASAPRPLLAAQPRPRRSSRPIAVAPRYLRGALEEQALRSARGLFAADGVDPGQSALSATLIGRDTVRVSASRRSDPTAPARVIVLKRTAAGYAVLDRGTPPPALPTIEPVAAVSPGPAPRSAPHAVFHRRRSTAAAEPGSTVVPAPDSNAANTGPGGS